MALQTGLKAHSAAQVDQSIQAFSQTVQQALSQEGEGAEASAESEIQNFIQSQVKSLVAENMMSEQTQKTNLEESQMIEHENHVSKQTLFLSSIPKSSLAGTFYLLNTF